MAKTLAELLREHRQEVLKHWLGGLAGGSADSWVNIPVDVLESSAGRYLDGLCSFIAGEGSHPLEELAEEIAHRGLAVSLQVSDLLELLFALRSAMFPVVMRYSPAGAPDGERYLRLLNTAGRECLRLFVRRYLAVVERVLVDQIGRLQVGEELLRAQNQRLMEQQEMLERRVEEITILNESAALINSTLELDQVLDAIIRQVSRLMQVERCAIFELLPEQRELRIRRCRGLGDEYASKVRIPVGAAAVGKAVALRAPVVVEDIRQVWPETPPPYIQPAIQQVDYRAILAVPLISKGNIFGCIAIYYPAPRTFAQEEKNLLNIFAGHAALAIDNARLYQKARELAVMEERNRLARELHDSVSQSLFSIVLNTEALAHLVERDPVKSAAIVGRLQDIAHEALAEMRALIFELRPAALEEKGLVQALTNHVDLFRRRNSLEVEFTIEGDRRLPPEAELALYRVAQEAMANVAKHARARRSTVTLGLEGSRASLTVEDDGQGFDLSSAEETEGVKSLGLTSMRERVEQLRGTLSIETCPGAGTRVCASIPLEVS